MCGTSTHLGESDNQPGANCQIYQVAVWHPKRLSCFPFRTSSPKTRILQRRLALPLLPPRTSLVASPRPSQKTTQVSHHPSHSKGTGEPIASPAAPCRHFFS